MANEIIYSLGADSEKYTSIFPAINKYRTQARLPLIPHGEEIVVHAGQLHPVHENQIRSQMGLPLIEGPEVTNTQPQKQGNRKKGRKSNYGRWEILNNFIDQAQTEFTPAQRAVWVTMFRMADGNSNKLYTSVRWLAKITGTSDTTVQGAITKLIKKGWLVRLFKGPTKGVPSLFKVQDGTQ